MKKTFLIFAGLLLGLTAMAVNSTDKTVGTNLDLQDNRLKKVGQVEIKQQATGTTATVGYGNIYFKTNGLPYFKDSNGMETPLVAGAGAQWVGTIDYGYASNCQWASTSSSFVNFSEDTDCNTPTVTGSVSAPGTKIPGVVVPVNDANAQYMFVVNGNTRTGSGFDACAIRISNGTDNSKQVGADSGSTADYQREFRVQPTSTGSQTFQLQMKSESAADSCTIHASLSAREFSIDVYKMGGTGAVGNVLNEWQDIDGVTFTGLGTVSGTTVKGRRVGDSLELLGYTVAGTVSGSTFSINLPSGYPIDTAKAGSSTRKLGDGHTISGSAGFYANAGWAAAIFSDGSDTDSLFAAYRGTGSVYEKMTGSTFSQSGAGVAFHVIVPITGWTGGVTGGGGKIYSARINNSGSCSVASGSEKPVDWISAASRPGAGQCSLTISMATAPHCWMAGINASTPVFGSFGAGVPTTTNVTTVMYDQAGSAADTDHFVFCSVE